MLTVLNPNRPDQSFPSTDKALKEPDGLLAVGGCLSPQRIINAYSQGIFPWFNPESPILWWSPDPRLVLFPEKLQLSRSLKKTLRQGKFQVTFDTAFPQVIAACATSRKDQAGTWINQDMQSAYIKLHQQGYAHSVETWFTDQLVGGLYGIALGKIFYGESMFHKKTDASKVAFASLVETLTEWGFKLIDCQVRTDHLMSLGAEEITRDEFNTLLAQYCSAPGGNISLWKKTPVKGPA